MKVILLQDIKNVGRKEQVIEANDGYARNYLFPKKLAIEASKDNMLKLQAKKTAEANKKKAEIEANKEIAKKIEKIELQIKAKSGENGKIFGGTTSKEIAEVIYPQFKESDIDTLTKIIERYKSQDTWKTNPQIDEDGFELIQDIMEEGGELSKRVPYNDIVVTDFSEKAEIK